MGEIDKWFDAAGKAPVIHGHVAHMMNVCELRFHGVGIPVCPESISMLIREQDACVRRVHHKDAYTFHALIWMKNHTLSDVVEEIISFIESLGKYAS